MDNVHNHVENIWILFFLQPKSQVVNHLYTIWDSMISKQGPMLASFRGVSIVLEPHASPWFQTSFSHQKNYSFGPNFWENLCGDRDGPQKKPHPQSKLLFWAVDTSKLGTGVKTGGFVSHKGTNCFDSQWQTQELLFWHDQTSKLGGLPHFGKFISSCVWIHLGLSQNWQPHYIDATVEKSRSPCSMAILRHPHFASS